MIPLLTVQAVEKKCNFPHVILLGNYELAYSLGVISRAANIIEEKDYSTVGELKERVFDKIENYKPTDEKMERLVCIAREMDSYTDEMNEQIRELYSMGYEKGKV